MHYCSHLGESPPTETGGVLEAAEVTPNAGSLSLPIRMLSSSTFQNIQCGTKDWCTNLESPLILKLL